MSFKDKTQNTFSKTNVFFLPFVLCSIQFSFIFVALFKSSLFFEKEVLSINIFLMIVWGGLFLFSFIRNKNIKFNIENIFCFTIFILLSLYIVKMSWFSGYLSTDAMQKLFSGNIFIDTLYHSSIAESIVTNGYPSIQQNAPLYLGYHAFSHYLIAGLSILLNLPCFVIYNYVYPIIVFPLLVFLLQKVIIIAREFIFDERYVILNLNDYIFLLLVICGFFSKELSDSLGFPFYTLFQSESYCVSIILLLIYICLVHFGYKKIKDFDSFNKLFLIPLFILILSFSKISTGCMFLVGSSYWLFRYKFSFKNIFYILFYGIVFCLYYYIIGHIGYVKPSFTVVNTPSFEIFHYVKHYSQNYFFAILHYITIFLPVILIIFLNSSKQNLFRLKKEISKMNLLVELSIVLCIIGCIPGILLVVDGGSAFYFVAPVYYFISIFFIASKTNDKLLLSILKKRKICDYFFIIENKEKKICSCNIVKVCELLILLTICYTSIKEIRVHDILKTSLYARIDKETQLLHDRNTKIKKMFEQTSLNLDENYNIFNEIRSISKKERKNFCIYISDDAEIINIYDSTYLEEYPTIYKMNSFLATTAYLGIPIINSIYLENEQFYRGDGAKLGFYENFVGYSMPPAICYQKISLEDIEYVANTLNKEKIIIISKNNIKILFTKE